MKDYATAMLKATLSGQFTEADCEHPSTVVEDLGIGEYEYFGARGIDRDLREVCTDCGQVVGEVIG